MGEIGQYLLCSLLKRCNASSVCAAFSAHQSRALFMSSISSDPLARTVEVARSAKASASYSINDNRSTEDKHVAAARTKNCPVTE